MTSRSEPEPVFAAINQASAFIQRHQRRAALSGLAFGLMAGGAFGLLGGVLWRPAFGQDIEAKARAMRVIDGDTIAVRGLLGGFTLRFCSSDAPETHRAACLDERRVGELASARLAALLREADIVAIRLGCPGDARTHDRHGRRLGEALVDGRAAGAILMAEGLSVPYRPGRESRPNQWCDRDF